MGFKDWNFKKQNEEGKKGKKESGIYKFLDKEGFYVVMFLCVCIVATTAVWVTKNNIDRLAVDELEPPNMFENREIVMEEPNPAEEGLEQEPVVVVQEEEQKEESVPVEEAAPTSVTPQEEEKKEKVETKRTPSANVHLVKTTPKQEDTVAALDNGVEAVEATAPVIQGMKMPVLGSTGMKYAADTLAYSKTLEQYTTHYGIDVMAPLNTPVVAAMAGEVVEVMVDSRLGITIAIAHEGDMITRYSNLSLSSMVKIGDKVEQGQTISGVGDSALFESADAPHLHFEVLVDGANVNPELYLPKK